VLGGSGNGEAIVANKVRGIRCALCWNLDTARLAREHNDSNVLSLGQRMIPEELALEIVKVWLVTPFAGGRHARRIALNRVSEARRHRSKELPRANRASLLRASFLDPFC